MKSFFSLLFSLLLMLAASVSAKAQDESFSRLPVTERFLSFSQLLSPEKLYLHTDREVYCAGDTVWFKGYLRNASQLSEFPECNYIYVELISSMAEKNFNTGRDELTDAVHARVKIKRGYEGFTGYLKIPENSNTGIATVRAYSYWMLNSWPEYMYFKNIEIRNPMKDDFVESLVQVDERSTSRYTEVGVVNPFDKVLKVRHQVDIQFLPESGRYLPDILSVIAVKAVSEDGLGEKVTGDIYGDDVKLASFETDELGMGRILLTVPSTVSSLYAMVSDEDGYDGKEAFPMPSRGAAVINVTSDAAGSSITIRDGGLQCEDTLFVVMYDKSEVFFKMPYKGETHFKVESNMMMPGINTVALVDSKGTVYAERPFFCYPEKNFSAAIVQNKEEYGPREKVSLNLDLRDGSGKLLRGDFSVSISDNGYSPYTGSGYNAVSFYYLGSEFKTFIEDSERYFDPEHPLMERITGIDLVMLTHGWRYYDLQQILTGGSIMPTFGKEYSQSISGVVKGSFKTARRSIVSFVAPSIGFSAMGQLDTTGWFALNGLDFPEGTKFLVGAVSLGGSTRRYTPYLDKEIYAKFHDYPKYLNKREYTSEYKYAALSDYYNNGGELVYSLNPSYIQGSRKVKEENISPLPYYEFKPGQYRAESELEPYASYDLLTYIVTTCPPLRFGNTPGTSGIEGMDGTVDDGSSSGGGSDTDNTAGISNEGTTDTGTRTVVCRVQRVSSKMGISSGWDEILVFVNGMPSSCAEIDGMTVQDIEGFAYIRGADAAKFGANVDNSFSPRSVVLIKTKMLAHDYAANVSEGLPLGWQKPAKVYAPKYDTASSRKSKEPMRSLLYWNPFLEASSEDGARFDFYTSDHKVDYTVVVEGFTEDGQPVSVMSTIRR